MRRASCVVLGVFAVGAVFASPARATVAQPVPLPEEQSVAPQLEIDGVGIGTLNSLNGADFSDSSLLVGAAQRLYDGATGSMGLGLLAPDRSSGEAGPNFPFFDQGFVDFQAESIEALAGRSDNPGAHLVDFPVLREDDLITMTFRLDPFSGGNADEENRYSNVASLTFNQGLLVFENIHAQHQLDSSGEGSSPSALNSVGITVEYLAPPGTEALTRVVSAGVAYEHEWVAQPVSQALDQISAGAVVNLIEGVTDRVDFRAQDILNVGSGLVGFGSVTDTYQARSNALAASLRYLHSPFGKPGYQLALTGGYRSFLDVSASEWGAALTAIKRLGEGFDVVAQALVQRRTATLASVVGTDGENEFEIGLIYNFAATLNEHLGARRTPLNYGHGYLAD